MFWLVVGILVVLLYALVLFMIARGSLWPPRVPLFFAPGTVGLDQQDVEFTTDDDVRVRGWWIEGKGRPSDVVAVMCHGYLMNRSELAPVAATLAQQGVSSLMFDFRCHGDSQRKKTGLGYFERSEVTSACEWVRKQRPDAQIVLIGSSMGSAAAAFAMADRPGMAQGLVLDSAYSRLDMAAKHWWYAWGGKALATALYPTAWLMGPVAGFDPKKADVAEALSKIEAPVLILHATRDGIARKEQAERNLAACKGPSKIVWFDCGGHSEGRCVDPRKYGDAIHELFVDVGNMARDQSRSQAEA